MGRAMLIISAGALVALGILVIGVNSQRLGITQNISTDANYVQIRNKAFTASQLAMERINESGGSWHPTEISPWNEIIEGDSISLYYKIDSTSTPLSGAFSYLNQDTIHIYASSWYQENRTQQKRDLNIIVSYIKSAMHFVPEFKSALSFATNDFNISAAGNSKVNGNDSTGTCQNRPAITTISDAMANEVETNVDAGHLESDSTNVAYDPDLSYAPVDELIARLSGSSGTTYISGNYKGDMGTEDDPGVFFVEDGAKLTGGITDGYGIMVVRSGGELAYDSSGVAIDIAGNFTFNGMVVFEDAYNLTGRGTPTINGSVLVGKQDESTTDQIDVDLSGDLTIQYNCDAEKFAQVAAAKELKQNRYTRLTTYE